MVSHWLSVCLSIGMSACQYAHPSICPMSAHNLSKFQWIHTNLGMCIDIEEIWFVITNGQTLPIS